MQVTVLIPLLECIAKRLHEVEKIVVETLLARNYCSGEEQVDEQIEELISYVPLCIERALAIINLLFLSLCLRTGDRSRFLDGLSAQG